MKCITKFLCFFIVSVLLVACNEYKGYKKTESGLYYQFYTQNMTGRTPENDDIVTISLEIRTEDDSVIHPTKLITTMMQPPKFQADIFEALTMMHLGDSASFIINAEKYFNAYNYGNQPVFVTDETMLWFTLSIKEIETSSEFKSKHIQMQIEEEKRLLNAYLNEHQLSIQPTLSGLYYVETKKGKGKSPVKGQLCTVNYKGMLLDGTVFDSSEGRPPFEFPLGEGRVIQGWDEGIAMMKKGGKATFIIPSAIAYGDRGAGDLIPPYTPLVFEVELVDFK